MILATLYFIMGCVVLSTTWAQLPLTVSDSLQRDASDPLQARDTSEVKDSLLQEGLDLEDLASADSTEPGYRVRHYDHRQQVVVGGVVMLCIGLALVAMNNYNPKR